jgi:glycine cleavage system aminomethyltransferase T
LVSGGVRDDLLVARDRRADEKSLIVTTRGHTRRDEHNSQSDTTDVALRALSQNERD